MVLANGGSPPCASPSVPSRTFSRPAGEVMLNMDIDPVRKMDTVVKLDAVRRLSACGKNGPLGLVNMAPLSYLD